MATKRSRSKAGKRPRRSRGAWLEEVVRWRGSGQRAEEYARSRGLHPRTLTFWASRLRDEVRARAKASGVAAPRFVPVRVVGKVAVTGRDQGETIEAAGHFEVALANGRRVRVSGTVGSQELARLLDVVEGGVGC